MRGSKGTHALLGVLMVGAVACGAAAPAPSPAAVATSEPAPAATITPTLPPEKTTVTFGVSGSGSAASLALPLASILGYFKDEGLSVTIGQLGTGQSSIAALTSGTVDYSGGSLQQVIQANAQGGRLVQTIVLAQVPSIALLVSSKYPDVKSPKDLARMDIGVTSLGSTTDILLRNVFKQNGLDPASAKAIPVGSGATAIAALTNDKVQAVVQVDPFVSQLVDAGRARILVDTRTLAATKQVYGGNYPGSTINTTTDFVRNYPRTNAAAMRAIGRALKYVQTHTAEQVVDLLPPAEYYPDGNKAAFATTLRNSKDAYDHDGTTKADMPANVIAALKTANPTLDYSSVDLAKTYDNGWAGK